MRFPPCVIIHSLADARLALSIGKPVTLLSAPGAACYGGCGWWSALMAAAGGHQPNLLDCADAPGRAVEALKIGLRGLILTCGGEAFAAASRLATFQNAVLLTEAPPALDLANPRAARQLASWLSAAYP